MKSKKFIRKELLLFVLLISFTVTHSVFAIENAYPSWVEETFSKMTLEEKVGQLLWMEVTDGNSRNLNLERDIIHFNPAGILIKTTSLSRLQYWSRFVHSISGKPAMMVEADLSLVEGIARFPNYLSMQNIDDENLINEYQEAILTQMKTLQIDRVTDYNAGPALILRPVSGHRETFKKALVEADGVILSGDIAYWFGTVYLMVKTGEIPRRFFESKVKKVLEVKKRLIDSEYLDVPSYLQPYIANSGELQALSERLYAASFKILNNTEQSIPVKSLLNTQHGVITSFPNSPELENSVLFKTILNNYYPAREIATAGGNFNPNRIFVRLTGNLRDPTLDILKDLDNSHNLLITYFGEYSEAIKLASFPTVLWHPEDNEITNKLAPQILFGAISIGNSSPIRLSYSIPEQVGMSTAELEKIDKILEHIVSTEAAPGGQVLIARQGKVVYHKSFGSSIYNDNTQVSNETLYDLASITKVFATLPAIMHLDETGQINTKNKAAIYLPELENTNKENVVIDDILMHQAGLYPYLPFWRQTVNEDGLIPELYSENPDENHLKQVSTGIYSGESLQDSLWKWTVTSRMRKMPEPGGHYDYKYSDLGFYIMKELIERVSGKDLGSFTMEKLYGPMGLTRLTFLPLNKYPPSKIAPTEYDNYFRNTLVHGTVHDQTAAMFGGVAGHAGLFGNANDVAKLMQMFLWAGKYGGLQFFEPITVSKFTQKQNSENRRGLGWDKPDKSGEGNTSSFASFDSFGHIGFTGTSVWADPEYNLIYVFLSNRVHPDAENNKLAEGNFRIRIQDLIYKSIQVYDKAHSF